MPIELVVVTPQGEAFRGPVESVVLPGSEGEFEVLENHERFLSPLDIGVAEVKTAEGSIFAALASGFADVSAEQVAVLVESCEVASDIDRAWAELEVDRAREGLTGLNADEHAERFGHYTEALRLAEARIAALEKS